ncbi:T9SS type A sorting domain-containing protein [Gracilimonas tropica]|uniref:T9SS type A sorting domain-containing protein n=1 Tax=Gracilimonas tropica TaxID=454600 RepID=UPI00036C3DF2|nr:T9SS type A sorting domain-containing protein [Gracilimonas tropica]
MTTVLHAQSPAVDNLYRVALNGDTVTVDGSLEDWSDAQWVYLSVDHPAYQIINPTQNSGQYPSAPTDASGWFAVKMDESNIYFAMNVRDENNPMISDADDAANLINYDHLNVFLGLYDIGPDAYLNPHTELLSSDEGYSLTDPVSDEQIYTGKTFRIAPQYDNTTTTLGPDYQIGVRAVEYGAADSPITYNYGYVNAEIPNTEVATSLWDDSKGYTLEWKVPFESLAGKLGAESGDFANFEWPLYSPQDGDVISLDATIGDADEVSNGTPDTERLTLGTGGGLDTFSSRFGFRGLVVDMSNNPNNTPRWTYSIDYKESQDVSIDADLSDWLDAPFMAVNQDIPNWVLIQGTPDSPDDFSGYLAIKMDTANIYFAVRVRDEGTPMIETLDTPNLAFQYDHLSAYLGLYDISDIPSNPHVEGAGEFEMYNFRNAGTDSAFTDTIPATRTYRIADEYDNVESTRGADYQLTLRALPYGDEPVDPEDYNGAYVDTVIFKGNSAAAVRTPDETGYIMEWKLPFSSLAGQINNRRTRSEYFGLEWPLFVPENGKVISFDADLTDKDEGEGARTANRFLRLGNKPSLWRDSKSFMMRGEIVLTNEKVGVSTEETEYATDLPKSIQLKQNYPNPFNPSTNIQFTIPQSSQVTLKVYNVLGQEVATLLQERKQAGTYTVRFDASSDLSSGIYLYRLEAAGTILTRKLTLIK